MLKLQPRKSSAKKKRNRLQVRIALEKEVYKQFKSRYSNESDFFNKKITNEIISNETAHIVALFKDYLISDDTSEFLQRYYLLSESKKKLPKIFEYYISCSVIFPNYVILHEAKYICKNIQRKQRVIDNQQMQEEEIEKKKKKKKEINVIESYSNDDDMFDTKVYDSLMNITGTNSVVQKAFGGEKGGYKNSSNVTVDKEDSCGRILSSIERCEVVQERKAQDKQLISIGLKKELNEVSINKVPTSSYSRKKNFFLNNCISTEGNNKSKDKIHITKPKQEFIITETASNFRIKKQNPKIAPIPITHPIPAKIVYHKNTFSMPKLSPRILNAISKHCYPRNTEGSIKQVSHNQLTVNTMSNSNHNPTDFIALSSRDSNKSKLNLKTELYELIATKYKKNSNISKKTIGNISTATPSLSLKNNHHHHPHQSQPKQINEAAQLTNTKRDSSQQRKSSLEHLTAEKLQQKRAHPSANRTTRNGMLNKANNGLFLYDSPTSLTELFKTTSTRQLTFSNDLERQAKRVIKTLHIKGFEEMLRRGPKKTSSCHSNRNKAKNKLQDGLHLSKSKSKR